MQKYSSIPLALSLSLLAVACGGKVDDPAPPAGIVGLSPAPAQAISNDTIDAAVTACSQPEGPVVSYDSVESLDTLLDGSWVHCGSNGGFGAVTLGDGEVWAGVEFDDGGQFYFLTQDSSGALVRAQGIRGTGEVSVEPFTSDAYNNVSGQINVTFPDQSVMPTRATFESGPRRLALEDIDGFFVPISTK